MSTPNLVATFVLKLEDKLFGGLDKLQRKFETLFRLAERFDTPGLDRLSGCFDEAGRGADRLGERLQGVRRAAQETGEAVAAMARTVAQSVIHVDAAGIASIQGAIMQTRRAAMLGTVAAGVALAGPPSGGIQGLIAQGPRTMPGSAFAGMTMGAGVPLLAGSGDAGGGGGGFSGIPLGYPGNPFPGRRFSGLPNYGRNLAGAVRGLAHSTEGAAGGIFGAMATGFGMAEPIRAASEYDNVLRHIAITANATGAAGDRMVRDLGKQFNTLALQTGQHAKDVAEASFYLIQAGMPKDLVDQLTGTSARVATAYNSTPEDVARTAFVLNENMKIGPKQMGGSLASLALAGKESHFSFPEMAQLFPEVAAGAASMGIAGRDGVDRLAAMLAISRKNTATGGQAATNMNDFMAQIRSPHFAKRMAGMGVSVSGVMDDAKKKGINPLEAILGRIAILTRNGTDTGRLGKLLGNQQSSMFVLSMLQHFKEYEEILNKLRRADDQILGRDFGEGMKSLRTQMGLFDETLEQLERRVGIGFVPSMRLATQGMKGFIWAMNWMDDHMPGVLPWVLGLTGGMLGLATVLGILGAVAGPIAAGWNLLQVAMSPIGVLLRPVTMGLRLATLALMEFGVPAGIAVGIVGALALAFVAASGDIFNHWDRFAPFFGQMWQGVKQYFQGGYDFIMGLMTGDWSRALKGVETAWGGLGRIFKAAWDVVKTVFDDFTNWVDGWSGGLATKIEQGVAKGFENIRQKASELEQEAQAALSKATTGAENFFGFGKPTDGQITVKAEPGTSVTSATSKSGPQLQVAPNRGRMLGRP